MLIIQCNIGGFGGEPITMLAVLNDVNMLTVVKTTPYTESRVKEESAFIGNVGDDLDYKFTDKDFNHAIMAFLDRKATDTLVLSKELARFEPSARLELDKVGERGRSYRIEQGIENGQIAVLVTCLFAQKQSGFRAANDMLADVQEVYEVLTI